MKFSEKWLREFVNPEIDTDELTHQLTMAGLEVDGVEPAYQVFEGLVVAEVKSVSKHPDADKLHVCQVDCGDKELLNIVCGAPNVKQGMRTILAKVGAKLPGKEQLKPVSLKGVQSHGMLCSASEIGLGDDHDGIIELSASEPLGKPLNELIDSDDNIIEISLTPNRGDCLSIKGIAREVGVVNQLKLAASEANTVEATSTISRKIKVSAEQDCPRYVGRVIEGVNTKIKSPLWLSEKLRSSGIRSINIIVDITNFVMLELGQPMHAFDNARLQGEINVRYPVENEKIKLLDESEYEVKPKTLLISDESGPLAMAGLMGGFESSVTLETNDIFLESAFFKPETIIGEARQYGLHTDSSHRFERGVDPELQQTAIERASELILQLCGGKAGPITEVKSERDIPTNKEVILRKSQIKRVLGIELEEEFVTSTFLRLGMECKFEENQWVVIAPSQRFDINIEVDLIEELARIYSYDAISVASPSNPLSLRPLNQSLKTVSQLREVLINRDYQEVITYSFVDPKLNKLLKNNDKTMLLANPIAPELAEMRTSLWPGLLNSLQYNLKRQRERVRLFETGLVFNGNEDLKQDHHIAGVIYGNINNKQWDKVDILSDFYDLKADIETIIYAIAGSESAEFKRVELDSLHPGQSVEITIDGNIVGYFGQLHPRISADLGLENKVYLFEIEVKKLVGKNNVNYKSTSRYPSVRRDIALLFAETTPYSDITNCVKKHATELLSNLELFDLYQGEGIEKGKKSLALGLTFQATSSTLKDEEVETIMGNIIDGLYNKFGAKLRE